MKKKGLFYFAVLTKKEGIGKLVSDLKSGKSNTAQNNMR